MKKLIILFLCLPILGKAQDTGIKFEKGLSWQQILQKADTEHKYIFVDCYATWCIPCKEMSATVFPQKQVGDTYNAHFVNIAVQMDQTAGDSPEIRNWYADAKSLSEKYAVTAYPTYLYFAPDGHLISRSTGTSSAADFIAQAINTLDSNKQYDVVMGHWKAHLRDTAYLLNALKMAMDGPDGSQARLVAEAYFANVKDLLTVDNLTLIANSGLIASSGDKWFRLFRDSVNTINKLEGPGYAQGRLSPVVFNDAVMPELIKEAPFYWGAASVKLKQKYPEMGDNLPDDVLGELRRYILQTIRVRTARIDAKAADWDAMEKQLKTQYPDLQLQKDLLQLQADYFYKKGEWQESAKAADLLMQQYGKDLRGGPATLNNLIWFDVFQHCDDRKILGDALQWMKYLYDLYDQGKHCRYIMDTYGNLLYKTGNIKDALTMEDKAVKSVQNDPGAAAAEGYKEYKANLEKMKKGEKTWME